MKPSISRFFGLSEKHDDGDDTNDEVHQLPVDKIVPNRFQPRTIFIDERIDELAQTIKTHGIIQPIIVRERDGNYEIIAGERRWRAVKKLGWKTIPGIIKEFNDSKTASIALIENLQREELTAIEEATAYAKLIELHGLTQESLAQRLGKSQSTIANKLRLLKLPKDIQTALLNKTISERHARALISLKDEEKQLELLSEIIEKQLNVKQTEQRVNTLLNDVQSKPKSPKRKAFSKDMRLALNTIRQSLDMVKESGLVIDIAEEDNDDFYQITIRIPKRR
mgnify:CR=1 FL=1